MLFSHENLRRVPWYCFILSHANLASACMHFLIGNGKSISPDETERQFPGPFRWKCPELRVRILEPEERKPNVCRAIRTNRFDSLTTCRDARGTDSHLNNHQISWRAFYIFIGFIPIPMRSGDEDPTPRSNSQCGKWGSSALSPSQQQYFPVLYLKSNISIIWISNWVLLCQNPWIREVRRTRDAVCQGICEHLLHVLSSRIQLRHRDTSHWLPLFRTLFPLMLGYWGRTVLKAFRVPTWLTLQVGGGSES